jgi:hypothetical protein
VLTSSTWFLAQRHTSLPMPARLHCTYRAPCTRQLLTGALTTTVPRTSMSTRTRTVPTPLTSPTMNFRHVQLTTCRSGCLVALHASTSAGLPHSKYMEIERPNRELEGRARRSDFVDHTQRREENCSRWHPDTVEMFGRL